MGKFCLNKYQKKMPRGEAGRGGMGKRTKKGNNMTKRELWYKEEGQEYAQVQSMLGNGRLRAMCFDGKVRLGTIRGKMRRRVYIFANDIILVGLRDFQDEKCDVIWKYYPEEAKTLKAMGEIPEHTLIDDKNKEPGEGEAFGPDVIFGEDPEEKEAAKNQTKPKKEALPMPSDDSEEDSEEDDEPAMKEEKYQPKQPTKTSNYVPQNALNKGNESSEEESDSESEEVDKLY